jgi:hypothetical protein
VSEGVGGRVSESGVEGASMGVSVWGSEGVRE